MLTTLPTLTDPSIYILDHIAAQSHNNKEQKQALYKSAYMFANAFLYGLQLRLAFLSRRLHLAINTFLQISAKLLAHLTHFFYTLCLQTQSMKY